MVSLYNDKEVLATFKFRNNVNTHGWFMASGLLLQPTMEENFEDKEVAVYDCSRKMVRFKKFKKENETQLNLEDLSSGTYFFTY